MKTNIAIALLLMLVSSAAAWADEPQKKKEDPQWNSGYTDVTTGEYIGTGVLTLGLIGSELFLKPTTTPHWTLTNPVDEAFRNTFRGSTVAERQTIGNISNVAVVTLPAFALGNAILNIGVGRKSEKGAVQASSLLAEGVVGDMFMTSILKKAIGRPRPCTRDSNEPGCKTASRDEDQSDPSGHSGLAEVAAMNVCMQAYYQDAFGEEWYKKLVACVAAQAGAAGVGLARIGADKHYATDVGLGLAGGAAMGALPWAIHVMGRSAKVSDAKDKQAFTVEVKPDVSRNYQGVVVSGTF